MKSSDVHWVIQTNLGAGSGLEALLSALQKEGVTYTPIDVIPFSDHLPEVEVPAGCRVFFYGSTLAVALAARERRWSPGVWFDAEAFTYTAWAQHYGEHLLNAPGESVQTTIAGALSQPWSGSDVFVRPERDMKEFNGAVWSTEDFLAFAREVVEQGGFPQVHADTPIVISPPHGITAEWRTFVTDQGEILGASQYRHCGRLHLDREVPAHVLAFAQERAKAWSPAPLFVLDVAQSGEGLFVVEAQCAHSAGFYAMPLRPWIQGVNRTVERTVPSKSPSRPGVVR